MDGPISQVPVFSHGRRFAPAALVALGLLAGCNTTQPRPATAEAKLAAAVTTSDGKRIPKPETCVACAEMRIQTAANPQLTVVQVEQLRDEARRAYQQALKIDEKYLPAYFGLAKLYNDMDKPEQAVETYQHGLKVYPKQAQLWFALGMCQGRHKQWEPALANLKKATELDPENYLYINHYGFTLASAGRFDDSYRYFEKTVGEAKAHYNIARVLYQANRDDECKDHLRKALMARPDLAPAQQMLVQLQYPDKGPGPMQQAAAQEEER